MRIAFHTPLNATDDGRISGDRRMASQIAGALERLGHTVMPVRDGRSYLSTPDPKLLERLRRDSAKRTGDLVRGWHGTAAAPDLWFTYHSYYKAPDLLGPAVSEVLDIPYLVAEASDSERRAQGEWAQHVALARATFGEADLHLCFTARDRQGVEPLCPPTTRFLPFPPFIDTDGPERDDGDVDASAALRMPNPGPPRLITVAMMRGGVKHDSHLALARTLARLLDRPWTLTLVGDGPLRPQVEQAFAVLPQGRVIWRGALPHADIAAELAGHDIFVWPGLGEAYGLVYLEAQAAGLPVVAYASGGVPATVEPGRTALLAPQDDEAALAAALARLIDDPQLRGSMGHAAARFVRTERTTASASRVLEQALALAVDTRAKRRAQA